MEKQNCSGIKRGNHLLSSCKTGTIRVPIIWKADRYFSMLLNDV
ncbi:hypothetical protein ICY_05200 [Bacillus cereus BAG2X1-3]|nr:hypothetical protein ICU_04999 [Bacillus cereus BAG2X1-1]EJS63725.1 hypothetical protein ICY_05200 [Bacillus cereus BAG2X1-3]